MKSNFIELPLLEFIRVEPKILKFIPPVVDLSDHNYIARFDGDVFELGYRSDIEWRLNTNTHDV